jgi:hypothetical protein
MAPEVLPEEDAMTGDFGMQPSALGSDLSGMASTAWGRTWLLAIVLAGVGVAAQESLWRALGVFPNTPDSQELWRFWRQRVYRDDGKVVVILGTSRAQSGISVSELQLQLPEHRIVQLSLPYLRSSVGLLRDLAEDKDFSGTIIMGLDVPLLTRSRWDDHRSHYEYASTGRIEYWNTIAVAWLRDHLSTLRPEYTLKAVFGSWLFNSAKRDPSWSTKSFCRQTTWRFPSSRAPAADDRKVTLGFRQTYERDGIPGWDSLAGDVERVDQFVGMLQSRGGDAVFVRLPSSGERKQLEDEYHPKELYWDRFVPMTVAQCVHYKDISENVNVVCQDGSHLSGPQSVQFTRALCRELFRRGVFVPE